MIFNLSIVDKNILKITGSPEEQDTNYKNSYTINVIKYQPSYPGATEILETLIASHDKEYSESLHTFTKDGHYIIDHIVLPNIEWAQSEGLSGYCTDGTYVYKLSKGDAQIDENGNKIGRDIKEIIEVNHESINKQTQETFSICFLHECYLSLCNKKFKYLMKNRCSKLGDDNFDLDLIGLSLSAIRYNLEFGYMTTAQTIVEDLYRCVNICNVNSNKHDCGCCSQS